MDSWLQRKFPSTSLHFKAALGVGVSLALCAYPVYGHKSGEKTKQGHDLFSQEKPEFISAGQEKLRREQAAQAKEALLKQEQQQGPPQGR